MKYFISLVLSLVLCSCTYSINMVHSEGTTSDVIDESDSVTPTTDLRIPLTPVQYVQEREENSSLGCSFAYIFYTFHCFVPIGFSCEKTFRFSDKNRRVKT